VAGVLLLDIERDVSRERAALKKQSSKPLILRGRGGLKSSKRWTVQEKVR